MRDHSAVGQYRLNAGDLRSSHAVGDDANAPGIRRDCATYGRRIPCSKIDAVVPASRCSMALHCTQRCSCAHRYLAGLNVYWFQSV
jgi:hypothetical protein